MEKSWISGRESIQGHFALVHPVPMDSQDHFRMVRSHDIAMCDVSFGHSHCCVVVTEVFCTILYTRTPFLACDCL